VATAEATSLTENEHSRGSMQNTSSGTGSRTLGITSKAPKGLSREIVEEISEFKSEPQWMREFRLKALAHFLARKQPTWGSPILAELDYDKHSLLCARLRDAQPVVGRRAEDVKRTLIARAFPRRSGSSSRASGRSTSPEVVYHSKR
jgi:Fe-S cluster assembly protein SufB